MCTSVRDVLKWERKKLKELGREQSEKQRPVLGCAMQRSRNGRVTVA